MGSLKGQGAEEAFVAAAVADCARLELVELGFAGYEKGPGQVGLDRKYCHIADGGIGCAGPIVVGLEGSDIDGVVHRLVVTHELEAVDWGIVDVETLGEELVLLEGA